MVSIAWICSETVSPAVLVWVLGVVMVMELPEVCEPPGPPGLEGPDGMPELAETIQAKVVWALEWPSVAVTVVCAEPDVVTVPEMIPEFGSMLRPLGNPVAE